MIQVQALLGALAMARIVRQGVQPEMHERRDGVTRRNRSVRADLLRMMSVAVVGGVEVPAPVVVEVRVRAAELTRTLR